MDWQPMNDLPNGGPVLLAYSSGIVELRYIPRRNPGEALVFGEMPLGWLPVPDPPKERVIK